MSFDNKLPFANKELGQHFLRDIFVIQTIVNDWRTIESTHPFEFIIEVGPGPAILTPHLKDAGRSLFLIEKDERFREHLDSLVAPENLLITDALKLSWDNFLHFLPMPFAEQKCWLVSNLPYNVGTPLMRLFLDNPLITAMTLMMQKEVAEKILPPQGLKNATNSLMCLMQNYFFVQHTLEVPPHAFKPAPKVESTVLTFKRREEPEIPLRDAPTFERFLRLCFGQKRKQLLGLLKSSYEQQKVLSYLHAIGQPPTIRAEALSREEITNLFKHLR